MYLSQNYFRKRCLVFLVFSLKNIINSEIHDHSEKLDPKKQDSNDANSNRVFIKLKETPKMFNSAPYKHSPDEKVGIVDGVKQFIVGKTTETDEGVGGNEDREAAA